MNIQHDNPLSNEEIQDLCGQYDVKIDDPDGDSIELWLAGYSQVDGVQTIMKHATVRLVSSVETHAFKQVDLTKVQK